jgi:hypothetical protein
MLVCFIAVLFAQDRFPGQKDAEQTGLALHSKAVDFQLQDQNGKTRTLASLLSTRGLVLVFCSADW